MSNKIWSNGLRNLLLTVFILIFSSKAWAALPVSPEEAITWCGPATGQMLMGGYPTGSCSILQEDVWVDILSHKVEPMWDTDPAGLKGAMQNLCPPTGSWVIHSRIDPAVLMHSVAYWMAKNDYPAAVLLDTIPSATHPAHAEHWVAIDEVVTDVNPVTNPSATLEWVLYNDPTDGGTPTWVSAAEWGALLQSVTKPTSSYNGKYVGIIEPPEFKGRLIIPTKVLIGKLILPKDALRHAAEWIEKYKPYEKEHYKVMREAKPLPPLLVNKRYGGYYIIPYALNKDNQFAQAAILVNAYTGNFQQLVVFKPTKYMAKEEAINLALKQLDIKSARKVDAELIFPLGKRVASHHFPIWKVTADNKVLGVGSKGKIFTKIPHEDFSISLPGKNPQGIAWDGKQLLVLDGETKQLHALDSRSGSILKSLPLKMETPKGLAFDGKLLWVADAQGKKIHAISPDKGNIVKSIKMEIPQEKGAKSFEGMTWDGKHLWTAFYAGFSSSFNQIDMETGRIIKSVFADCHPRGIASDGKRLWSICYNGKNLPAKIDSRKILDKEHEMLRSRQFIKNIEGNEPIGLVYDGESLWYADKKLKKVFRFYPGSLNEQKTNR